MTWPAIENAIEAWLLASGISSGSAVWANQDAPQIAMPYVSMRIEGPRMLAPNDEMRNSTDLSAPAGEEITQTVIGPREITVSLQCYSNTTTGANTAKEYLQKAQTALGLSTVRYALNVAGLSVIDPGAINDLTALLEGATKFQSRAAMDVRMYLVDDMTEKVGYIDTVETNPEWS